jgi:hypothetical protein
MHWKCKEKNKAQFTSLMADKYEEYDQIYTDGSLKDDKVRFTIVTNNQIIKKRMKPQSSIYSAEQQAIITTIENTTRSNKLTIIAIEYQGINRWLEKPNKTDMGPQPRRNWWKWGERTCSERCFEWKDRQSKTLSTSGPDKMDERGVHEQTKKIIKRWKRDETPKGISKLVKRHGRTE